MTLPGCSLIIVIFIVEELNSMSQNDSCALMLFLLGFSATQVWFTTWPIILFEVQVTSASPDTDSLTSKDIPLWGINGKVLEHISTSPFITIVVLHFMPSQSYTPENRYVVKLYNYVTVNVYELWVQDANHQTWKS